MRLDLRAGKGAPQLAEHTQADRSQPAQLLPLLPELSMLEGNSALPVLQTAQACCRQQQCGKACTLCHATTLAHCWHVLSSCKA